jgi:hypothetical protein
VAERPIYIVLTDTGTWFTRMIRMYTRAPLNHTSIAFDAELREVYSFGRKRPGNPFVGGFVKEDFCGELFRDATCAVYKCMIHEKHYNQIRSNIRRFEREAHLYKYNLLGLFGVMFGIKIKRDYAFFCSQFVAFLFEQAGLHIVPKCPSFTKPSDFANSESLELIYSGYLRDYLHMQSRSAAGSNASSIMLGHVRSSV